LFVRRGGYLARNCNRSGKVTAMDDWNKPRALQSDYAGFERDDRDRQARREDKREQEAKRHDKLDDALDKALEESFPGSDPISITQPPQSVYDKHERQKR
jgi:hypothetical protein